MTGFQEEVTNELAGLVGLRRPAVGDRDDAAFHGGGGVLLMLLGDRHLATSGGRPATV